MSAEQSRRRRNNNNPNNPFDGDAATDNDESYASSSGSRRSAGGGSRGAGPAVPPAASSAPNANGGSRIGGINNGGGGGSNPFADDDGTDDDDDDAVVTSATSSAPPPHDPLLDKFERRLRETVDADFFHDPSDFTALDRVVSIIGAEILQSGGNITPGSVIATDFSHLPSYRSIAAQRTVVEEAIEHMALRHCADLNSSVSAVGRMSRQFDEAKVRVRNLRRQVTDVRDSLRLGEAGGVVGGGGNGIAIINGAVCLFVFSLPDRSVVFVFWGRAFFVWWQGTTDRRRISCFGAPLPPPPSFCRRLGTLFGRWVVVGRQFSSWMGGKGGGGGS